jgi:hypothetical protein
MSHPPCGIRNGTAIGGAKDRATGLPMPFTVSAVTTTSSSPWAGKPRDAQHFAARAQTPAAE